MREIHPRSVGRRGCGCGGARANPHPSLYNRLPESQAKLQSSWCPNKTWTAESSRQSVGSGKLWSLADMLV